MRNSEVTITGSKFYDLSKKERVELVEKISKNLRKDIESGSTDFLVEYFSDGDTYIRKAAYLSIGRLHKQFGSLRSGIIEKLNLLLEKEDFKIRQTIINAAGEIGMFDFETVEHFFNTGLFDKHHSVRNAVIGSVKKMGQKNPGPVLDWARQYLHHPDKEIRREICHGIELRGRTHPEDILPLLKELQNDKTSRVRNTLIHVIGQIAYKKGCLKKVIRDLITWENRELVLEAIEEIIDVHHRYRNFSSLTQQQAIEYIKANFK